MKSLRSFLAHHEEFFRRTLLLAVLFSLPACLAINPVALIDPDVWWHLRTGQWMFEHGAVPTVDHFSSYGMGKPWVAYSWLFEVLLFGLYRVFGLTGIFIYTVTLLLLITLALFSLVRKLQTNFVNVVALTIIGIFVVAVVFTPRPWLFTILFFIVLLDTLLTARRTRSFRRLLLLPPLFALWANLHIQFVYGLFVIILALAEPLLDRLLGKFTSPGEGDAIPVRWMAPVAAACLLATLLNPYHLKIYVSIYEYATQPGPYNYIKELQSLGFRFISDWIVLLMTVGAAFALAWQRKLRPFPILLLLAGMYISFRSTRDAWFVAIVGISIIASSCSAGTPTKQYKLTSAQVLVIATVIGAAILFTVQARNISEGELKNSVANTFPAAAVDAVEQSGYKGPLYNSLNWGGYLIWRLPQLPVSVDGRTNLHGDERIERSLATWSGKRKWDSDPELAAASLVIAPIDGPLTSLLRLDGRFKLVYEDNVAAIYVARKLATK